SNTLAATGKYDEAERAVLKARAFFDAWLPPKHYGRAVPRLILGRLRVEQRRPSEAVPLFQEALDLCTQQGGCPPRVRAEFLWDLGRAQREAGRWHDAIENMRTSLAVREKIDAPNHAFLLRIRVDLADALRGAGDFLEASATLSAINPRAIADLRPHQQALADLRRVQGLLWLESKDSERARSALQELLEILNHRLGTQHWRTERARDELLRVQPSRG
ncbi:MAG: tetratricopeptide repeat protein, partial [Arenimonas sp.]